MNTTTSTTVEMPRAMNYSEHDSRLRRISIAQTFRLIRSDLAFRCSYENKRLTWLSASRMLLHPGVGSVVRYRFQCFFFANHMGFLGRCLKFINLILYGIELDERAQIGGGMMIVHAVSVFITKNVVIGERCVIFHQTSIGASPFLEPGQDPGQLTIGDDVTFGGGSCVYGNIVIGDGCKIGANTVVERSFPAGTALFGVPARVITKTKPGQAEPG